ncbi:hypothetical protein GUJ93_ZPchr0013g36350 [Zizania palustris]|uniref:Uncharacterized protein n=1 Tax=Zizania palustris TaxID=103762 RepID=A0A8J6BZX3_ZIZPA|nr:hypothetical protein GUJ93_ZPchr0013g36350 [Zizania palustris]
MSRDKDTTRREVKAMVPLVVGGVTEKHTKGRAGRKLVRSSGRSVGIAGAPKDTKVSIERRGAEQGMVRSGSPCGLGRQAVEQGSDESDIGVGVHHTLACSSSSNGSHALGSYDDGAGAQPQGWQRGGGDRRGGGETGGGALGQDTASAEPRLEPATAAPNLHAGKSAAREEGAPAAREEGAPAASWRPWRVAPVAREEGALTAAASPAEEGAPAAREEGAPAASWRPWRVALVLRKEGALTAATREGRPAASKAASPTAAAAWEAAAGADPATLAPDPVAAVLDPAAATISRPLRRPGEGGEGRRGRGRVAADVVDAGGCSPAMALTVERGERGESLVL